MEEKHGYDCSDFEHYEFYVGRYKPYDFVSEEEKAAFKPYEHVADKRLVWNVIVESAGSAGSQRIEVYNIFEHGRFARDLLDDKRKCKVFEDFAESVRRDLYYYFGSKCEWEVVVTSWPPYIDSEELDRLNKDRDDPEVVKWGGFRYSDVRLDTEVKIDVYTQVMMNWDNFISYLWNNRRLLTKKKLGLSD